MARLMCFVSMCVAAATGVTVPMPTVSMVEPVAKPVVPSVPLVEGMAGWDVGLADGPSSLGGFPAYYETGFIALVPTSVKLLSGTEVTFSCPEERDGDCDAVVFMYHCAPCESAKGGVAQTLAEAGFERSACGPHFRTGKAGGLAHHMVSWRMAIGAGTTTTVTLEGDAEWLVFAVSRKAAVACTMFEEEAQCEGSDAPGLCQWTAAGVCKANLCRSQGPSRGCAPETCVGRDLETAAPPTAAPQTVPPQTSAPPTSAPPTSAPPTSAPPTSAPPTSAPPTSAPPTSAPPTSAPPTPMPVAPTNPPRTFSPLIIGPPTPPGGDCFNQNGVTRKHGDTWLAWFNGYCKRCTCSSGSVNCVNIPMDDQC